MAAVRVAPPAIFGLAFKFRNCRGCADSENADGYSPWHRNGVFDLCGELWPLVSDTKLGKPWSRPQYG